MDVTRAPGVFVDVSLRDPRPPQGLAPPLPGWRRFCSFADFVEACPDASQRLRDAVAQHFASIAAVVVDIAPNGEEFNAGFLARVTSPDPPEPRPPALSLEEWQTTRAQAGGLGDCP